MSFQDELNRVTKTPEDVLSKREKESYAKGVDSAQRSYEKIKEELADVLNYALLIANKYNFDVAQIILDKIEKNAQKYPVEKAKGTAKKYNEL